MRAQVAGRGMRRGVARAAALTALWLLPSAASAELAWWLTARFSPGETSYEGVAARDIHPAWQTFSVLTYAALPKSAKPDLAWMRKGGFSFERDGDFNRDGRRDRAVAGVYRDTAGRSGRFLLVLERQGKTWRRAFLHTDAGEPGFSVIFGPANQVHWGPCMECDVGSRLRRRGKTYALTPAGPTD